ncbi:MULTISPECIES: hypothetical protein [Dethiosulfovibrio]|jgi:hypothetical protein|uniref:Uncharacterized protein n=2 Tax=Dethiosulfovibrio TaxID=47054 RepID=A0ABS9ERR4_9BACT|nr:MULTISPECIES: hypothetical protein [Dethiosulfovibrio]MCF4113345.1 hypothetical protein [Dethiosulfovibrio russensis]MCF4142518.1 hypothetical protein [Dethiosulfovibrio marinus]MCF4145806.1 hypothetical protein [Dethiosulfovibrio acidaminovorans]
MTHDQEGIFLRRIGSTDLLYLLDEISGRTDQASMALTEAVREELKRRDGIGLNNRKT